MVWLGVGEVIGALFMAKCIDKLGTRKCCQINVANIAIAVLIIVIVIFIDPHNRLACTMTLFWGFQDSAVTVHINSILGFEFEEESEQFSVSYLLSALMALLFMLIQAFIVTKGELLLYILIVGAIGICSSLSTRQFEYNRNRKIMCQSELESLDTFRMDSFFS